MSTAHGTEKDEPTLDGSAAACFRRIRVGCLEIARDNGVDDSRRARRRCPWATGRRGGGPPRRPRARTPRDARLERLRPLRNPGESRGGPYGAVHQGRAHYRPRVGRGEVRRSCGKKIALFNLQGSFYAIDDTCTHRGGPLCEGEVAGEEVTCPWHGAVYNIKTGAVLKPPAPQGVASYPVRVQGADVEVEV